MGGLGDLLGDVFGGAGDFLGSLFGDTSSAAGDIGAATAAGAGAGAIADASLGAGADALSGGMSAGLGGAASDVASLGAGAGDYAAAIDTVGSSFPSISGYNATGDVGTLAQQPATGTLGAVTTGAPAGATAGVLGSAASTAAPASVAGTGADVTDPYAVGGDLKGAASPTSDWTAGSNAAGGAAKGNSIVNAFENPSFSTVGTALGNNANWLLPAAALGGAALLGNAPAKGSAQVSQEAAQLAASGQQLQSYLANGTLPPGVQASINSAAQSAKAAIRQQYAKNGMSGSTAEIEDLQNVDTKMMSQGVTIAEQLMTQGVQDTQISAQLYGELMKSAMSSDQSLVTALGALAGSAARPTINITGG